MNGSGEEVLSRGYSAPVVRVDDTMRRATGPSSLAVHGLIRHLEGWNFDGAPRFLGFDDRGDLHPWRGRNATRLLRRYYDATVGYAPPDSAIWQSQARSVPRSDLPE